MSVPRACPSRLCSMPTMTESSQASTAASAADEFVPESVLPAGRLPALRYRDMPAAIPLRKMIGPSIILAGLALGSGEFILWPYITYRSGFIFFWACIVGVTLQYFINMEISRWTLATGESAVTGFCRLGRIWGPVFLFLTIVPHMIPAWAKGGAELVCQLTFGNHQLHSDYVAIGGLLLCGIILTLGPVVYKTVELMQLLLVGLILIMVVALAILLVRPDAVMAQAKGLTMFGHVPPESANLSTVTLLGALAFAGAGGALNLGQSNYIKDKGYGMGRYVGRITSPVTGQEEAISETGYLFQQNEANIIRFKQWWRRANTEHFFSFYVTCVLCLVLLSLICYSVFYDHTGTRTNDAFTEDNLKFVIGEADTIGAGMLGGFGRVCFLLMGVAILFTTEFGILDVATRISTDLIKVNWLRENARWSESRLYYLILWITIASGSAILLIGTKNVENSLALFKFVSSFNGAVMALYCMTLLYINKRLLPPAVRMNAWRTGMMVIATGFFGFFSVWVGWDQSKNWLASLFGG